MGCTEHSSSCNARDTGDAGLIPGSGGGNGNPLQYSCLENPMDRGAWRARVHRVTKSQRRLEQLGTHTHTIVLINRFCEDSMSEEIEIIQPR